MASVLATVPRAYPGGIVACLASGPSLTAADAVALARVTDAFITVNDACRLVPTAPILFGDPRWWRQHPDTWELPGQKYMLAGGWYHPAAGIHRLQRTGQTGLDRDPTGLRSGGHSGYAAINLAYHLGARVILLLGYDMQPQGETHHFFGNHDDGSHPRYAHWLPLYAELAAALAADQVQLLNLSRQTALTTIPVMDFDAYLFTQQAQQQAAC